MTKAERKEAMINTALALVMCLLAYGCAVLFAYLGID